MGATFSPDGQWIAYASTQQSRMTLYIQRFPSGPRYPLTAISSDTPKHPRWSHDGKELCYDPSVGGGFVCLRISTEPFTYSNAVKLPRNIKSNPPGSPTNYDIAKDGRLVGWVTAGQNKYGGAGGASSSEIQFVLNWFAELRAKIGR
jgi:hypothetical protein